MSLLGNFHRYRIFKNSIVVLSVIFIVTTLVLSIVGYAYFNFQKEKIVDERFQYMSSISNFKRSQINDWLTRKYNQLEFLRINIPLNFKTSSVSISYNNKEDLKKLFTSLKTFYQYDIISLVDSSARIIYSSDSTGFKIESIDSVLSYNCIKANSIIFSDSEEKYTSEKYLTFYTPFISNISQGKKNIFSLILKINPDKIFDNILNKNIVKSASMESVLVKPFKDRIVYLNTLKSIVNSKEPDVNRKAMIEANSIKSRKGFIEGRDYINEEVIALIQNVPSTCWMLIVKINKDEFYSPVTELTRLIVLTILSIDMFFAFMLFFIWRKSILTNYKKIFEAESEKSKMQNRFETLVNGVKDIAIFILDHEGKIISWNEGAQRIEGYSSEEILGNHFSIFYSKEEIKNKIPDNNLKYAIEFGSYLDEGWRIKKDGSVYWANVSITGLKDETGNVYGFLKVIRDLTERKKGEEEIRDSRDFYLKLLNGFPTPVWISGIDGKCTYFNSAWLNYTGKKIEEELGDGWTANLHPDEKEHVVSVYYDSFKKMKEFTLEYRLKDSHGEYRWMIDFGRPYFDIDNNFAGYLGSCYDINDRKNYEQTINTLLRIGEKLYSSLEINQILDSLVTECVQHANAEGGFACVKQNEKFHVNRYFNKDHWEYFEKNYQAEDDILSRFNTNENATIFVDNGNVETLDQELVLKYKIHQAISVPLYNSENNLIGFFEIHNKKSNKGFNKDDISLLTAFARSASVSIAKSLNYEQLRIAEKQLRNSESELRNLAAKLQYARETERQSIAREVHDELGQLFTGINLNISLLAELLETNKKPTLQEIMEELHSVQKFVDKGIQAVRDISGSLRSYVLDHLGFIPAVQEYCREISRISNIKCNFKSEVDAFNFEDERNVALFRIIQEGITNVLRHADASVIDIAINLRDNNLEIIIADNGKGILEENETNPKSMGILGMKERAIFLDAKLVIDSIKGKGTTINLLVPLQ